MNDLKERWTNLWRRLGAGRNMDGTFDDLVRRYSEPHRRYHTLAHVEKGLAGLDAARGFLKDPDAVELAYWFHDAVYEVLGAENEERSAVLARDAIRAAGLSDGLADAVEASILATVRHDPPEESDAAYLTDADLGIFGAPSEAFDRYERQIREECAAMPDDLFAFGRAYVLGTFLSRERIYRTAFFRERLEARARENLARAHARWSTP